MSLLAKNNHNIDSKKSFKNIRFFNILTLLKKQIDFIKFQNKMNKSVITFFYNTEHNSNNFKYLTYKLNLFKQVINKNLFSFIYKSLFLVKALSASRKLYNNFYKDRLNKCGIVKSYLNFTNTFILLTNLKGEIKCWVSAGTGGFISKLERYSPQVPISLCFRISNVIAKKKFRHIKLQFSGPSKKFRSKVYYSLKNRSWIRKFDISCIEDSYMPAFNGCRLKKL
jgi:ribosomal protein S11